MRGLIYLFLVSLIFLGGCGLIQSLSSFEQPTVTYKDFNVDGLSLEGIDLIFDFDINNPNRVGMKAERYSYEFFINDNSFLSGSHDYPFEIQGGEVKTVQLPLSMNFNQLYQTFRSIAVRDSIKYELNTEVEFDAGIAGTRTVPLKAEGYLPVIQVPSINFEGFNLKEFNMSGAEIEFSVNVKNPNSFGMSFSNVAYSVDVNQNKWVESELEETLRVGAESDVTLEIPVKVSLADFGSTAMQILSGNTSFNYRLSGGGELSVDLPYVNDSLFLPFDLSGEYSFSR